MIHKEPYYTAIKNVESGKLMKQQKLTCWTARLNWANRYMGLHKYVRENRLRHGWDYKLKRESP
ncbi:MAG: hypothetical protein ACLRZZ_11480 [Enterocloster sp.]